jgi:protein-S-isoprenylcysteine O-methyltransferase Ste14
VAWAQHLNSQAHVAGIAVAVVLDFVAPWRAGLALPVRLESGAVAAVGGLFFIIWAVLSAGPVHLAKPVGLVTTDAYRRSRNPMYVGWTLAYLGISMLVGSVAARTVSTRVNHCAPRDPGRGTVLDAALG